MNSDLTNATAIGNGAVVNASNKIRLGNDAVTVIEGQVPYTYTSDKNQKEHFEPVDADAVLARIGALTLASWNYIGHDPQQFRHYGPVAQDFFAAFGQDRIGTIGTPTTINSGDLAGILMIGVQALQKRTKELQQENDFLKARLEAIERRLDGSKFSSWGGDVFVTGVLSLKRPKNGAISTSGTYRARERSERKRGKHKYYKMQS